MPLQGLKHFSAHSSVLGLVPTGCVLLFKTHFKKKHRANRTQGSQRLKPLKHSLSTNGWQSIPNRASFFHWMHSIYMAWDYMFATLEAMGFPQGFWDLIRVLYTKPTVQFCGNGHLSDAFSISNGIREGCPLSPLLHFLTRTFFAATRILRESS